MEYTLCKVRYVGEPKTKFERDKITIGKTQRNLTPLQPAYIFSSKDIISANMRNSSS